MIVCATANHKKVPVPMLESLSFKRKDEATKKCCSLGSVKEAVILQTCHRVEVYVATNGNEFRDIANRIVKFWSQEVGVSSDVVHSVVEVLQGRDALLHLLHVASGLESVVIGEDQILGQVRMACVDSKRIGTLNGPLEKAFMKAVNVGRRVRSETRINRGSASVPSAAVDLAEKGIRDLKDVRALVVGAGEAGSIVAEELMRRGAGTIFVANRTFEKGRELAERVRGKAIAFEELYNELRVVDLVVFAVSVGEPLLTLEKARNVLCSPQRGRVMLIDISQPRCVEEAVSSLPGVDLRNIDDVKLVVERSLKQRLNEAQKANRIVLEELEGLETFLSRALAEPLISALCMKADRIRDKEFRKALRMIGSLNEEQKLVIENLTKELAERILQLPIESVRKAASGEDVALMSAAKKLFELD